MKRFFQSTAIRLAGWNGREDEVLLKAYEELGPAWTLLSLKINSHSPIECRRRWLKVSGTLDRITDENVKERIYKDGYDLIDGRLVKIPMETIVSGPFHRLASAVKRVPFARERKVAGWSTFEKLALREGYELYGPNWKLISAQLQYRTAIQCRNTMLKRFISEEHLNKHNESDWTPPNEKLTNQN